MERSEKRTVCVVGLGYIGLPTATVLATHGAQVVGVDINPVAVETINSGKIHFVEPDLEAAVFAAVSAGRLQAYIKPRSADVFIIAVPTPFRGVNREPDCSYIEAAAASIAPCLTRGNLVILESTSPVGATEAMSRQLAGLRPDLAFPTAGETDPDVNVAYCPERVLPGQVLRELIENDRVIGGLTPRCAQAAVALYRTFVRGECIIAPDARTAEMCKLTENAFRDVNIAFANELSLLCNRLNIDVWRLIQLANRHPRVKILQPGTGVGGHCIAVDPWFLVHSAPDVTPLIRASRLVNDQKPEWVVSQIAEATRSAERPVRKVAVLGLAFKPDIDDLRESPALQVAEQLCAMDLEVLAVEPHIDDLPPTMKGRAKLCGLSKAVAEADVIAVLVKHTEFASLRSQAFAKHQKVLDFVGAMSLTRRTDRA